MEEEMRNILVDVSSFMLIEATGDSEFDSNNFRTCSDPLDVHDDDDAMTICSCTSDQSIRVYDDEYLKMDLDPNDEDHDDDATSSASCCHVDGKVSSFDNDSEEEDEDNEDVVEQRWIGHGGGHRNKSTKASKCVDLAKEKLKNQKDDDGLFWETCLGS